MDKKAREAGRSWIITALIAVIGFVGYHYLMFQAGEFDPFQRFKAFVKLFILQWQLFDKGDVPFLVDTFLFLASIAVCLLFLGLFVLPIQSLNDGIEVFKRLVLFLVRQHGPAILIKNGQVDLRPVGAVRSRGPGFALLDNASATMLRNAVAYQRTIGPGLSFTRGGEYVESALDLHVQLRPQALGPLRGEEPFAPQKPKESADEYSARLQRRRETSGLTRDGVEVVPNITVLFRLDPSQDTDEVSKRNFQYGFYPSAVYKAITSETIAPNAENAEPRKIPWNEHAAFMAIDLWREYLRKFTLNELFTPFDEQSSHGGGTAYEIIQDMVRKRLTRPEVEALDANGLPTGRMVPSREFEAMKSRGIQVLDVPIRNLRLPPAVEEQLVKQWFASWELRARAERETIDQQRSYSVHQGQQDGLKDFSRWAVKRFEPDFLNALTFDNREEYVAALKHSLENFLRGTLDQSVADAQLHQRLTNEEHMVAAVLEWVKRQPENDWDELNRCDA